MADDLLSYHEVEEILESILSNATFRNLPTRTGSEFVLFRYPATREILYSRYIKKRALEEARAAGLASKEELEQVIRDRQILTEADELQAKALEEKVSAQRRLLQITRIEGRRAPIVENIARFETEIFALRSKGRELLYYSSEVKAEEEAFLFLVFASVYNMDFERRWSTFSDFENEHDLIFRNAVIENFSEFNRGLTTATIRFIARHNLWRLRYNAANKLGGRLFSTEMVDWTPDQVALVYWSSFYQNIYEMMPDDRPEDDVIADDEALDNYLTALYKQKEEERNEGKVKRRGGSSKKGKLSAWNRSEELIITAAHPEYMSMQYSEERIKASGSPDVEVVAPNSKRARNRAQARRNRRDL